MSKNSFLVDVIFKLGDPDWLSMLVERRHL